jgi:uncharacterized protein (DUF736 family)
MLGQRQQQPLPDSALVEVGRAWSKLGGEVRRPDIVQHGEELLRSLPAPTIEYTGHISADGMPTALLSSSSSSPDAAPAAAPAHGGRHSGADAATRAAWNARSKQSCSVFYGLLQDDALAQRQQAEAMAAAERGRSKLKGAATLSAIMEAFLDGRGPAPPDNVGPHDNERPPTSEAQALARQRGRATGFAAANKQNNLFRSALDKMLPASASAAGKAAAAAAQPKPEPEPELESEPGALLQHLEDEGPRELSSAGLGHAIGAGWQSAARTTSALVPVSLESSLAADLSAHDIRRRTLNAVSTTVAPLTCTNAPPN